MDFSNFPPGFKDEFMQAVQQGVKKAVSESVADNNMAVLFQNAVKDAVADALADMRFARLGSRIEDLFYNAARQSIKDYLEKHPDVLLKR